MTKQFFIPDSTYATDFFKRKLHTYIYAMLEQELSLSESEKIEKKRIYSLHYIDSNRDTIHYEVGKPHPHNDHVIIAIIRTGSTYNIFTDKGGMQHDRLRFGISDIDGVTYFDPSSY
ncbi:hypothetical protein [Sphingobacterium sp. LRF_L2]|uniref:hypothetical protein n=1 Tax=Sphingobacterium sp. LRF_L2 TaxID=3369421 RepID=UPI003F61FD88